MEDTQPNEVRLARKGSTSVPRVRTSSRAFPFHSNRGRGSARIHGHPHSQHWHTARNVASPAQITQRAHHPTLSNTTAPYHRNHPSPHDSRPFKRIKVESSDTPSIKTEKAPEQVLVQLPFPPECHKGAPGCHKARQAWIQGQKHRIKTERQLSDVEFRYMETEQSVQFTCRTLQFRQSTSRGPRGKVITGPQRANAQVDAANNDTADRDVMVPRMLVPMPPTKDRVSQRSVDQSNVAGPSRAPPPVIRPASQALVDNHLERVDNRSLASPSGNAIQKRSIGTPLVKMSSPVQHMRTNRAPRRGISIRVDPSKEDIIDLTLDHPSPVAESGSTRWATFRSGTLDVSLSLLTSDSRVPAPAPAPDTLPRVEPPPHTSRKLEETPAGVRGGSSLSPQPDVQRNKTFSVPPAEYNRLAHSALIHGRNTAGHSRDQPIVLEDDPEEFARISALALTCSNLPLSLGPHDKPRRLLHEAASTYVVTAHGTIDQVRVTNTLNLDCNIRSPSSPLEEFVDDACMLSHRGESVMILGHAREQNQLSILKLRHGHSPRAITLHRDRNALKRPGVSALAALTTPSQFVSGGYDHRVHLWDVAEDLSGASASELGIRHTAGIHSLLPIVDTSRKLVSVGADCNVRLFDMSSERVGHSFKTSNIPFHSHKTDFRFCTLLEVAHLDTQFEVHDHRTVSERPVQRFGFTMEEKNGRYKKGDAWSHFFICGDRNGNVRLWDLRNVSTEAAYLSCFRDQVMQVVKRGPRVLACSRKNELACIDFQAG